MPYVDDEAKRIANFWGPENAGQLNYSITAAIKGYLNDHGVSYQTMNDIIGALEGAKLEFYRRIVAPYEDEKIVHNGDVY